MKISASIYSSRDKDLASLVKELDAYRIDYFHVDCNDDPSVFNDIRAIRKISKTPIDLHLICSDPEKYWSDIIDCGVELVTLQLEDLVKKPDIPKELAGKTGLSITSATPVEAFKDYAQLCSFVLFMTTVPGQSGGTFGSETFRRIRKFRSCFPDKKIHVDGGINAEVSFILRNMGVDAAVIGSYLFKGEFIGSAIIKLRSDNVESRYCVRDFMMQADEVPLIRESEMDLHKVLRSIDDYRMGFTMIAGEDGMLKGIISNADVRKALLRNINQLDKMDVAEMINPNPAFAYEDMNVSEMLNYIKNLPFPVLFLPVVNHSRKITGTIKFNNLIKGES
jgi:pentose-5-phosphate-3-epimerase